MKLSRRLALVAESVSGIETMADIGTDHGALPIMLVKSGRCQKAIASDINKGPVDIVTVRVGVARLNEKIEIRKGNGLKILKPGEVQLIVIAGMGGALISEILGASYDVCQRDDVKLILQPNIEPGVVRRWLIKNSFQITREDLVYDQGKFYEMMWAEFTLEENHYPGDFEGLIGGYLVKNRHELAALYLQRKLAKVEDVLVYLEVESNNDDVGNKENIIDRLNQIKKEIELIKSIIKELS